MTTYLRDTDQALVAHLRTLGDEWGPMGVALVAAELAGNGVVLGRLLQAVQAAPATPDAPSEITRRELLRPTGVHAGRRPAPSYLNVVLWLVLVLACGCGTGALMALLVR